MSINLYTYIAFLVIVFFLLSAIALVTSNSRAADIACLRVIARMDAPVINRVLDKGAGKESGVCKIADYLQKERRHGN
jgi:hypothetical protein